MISSRADRFEEDDDEDGLSVKLGFKDFDESFTRGLNFGKCLL